MQNFFRFTLVHPSLPDLVSDDCPIGWEGQVFGMERNPDLHGIFSEYDSSLKYVHAMQAFIDEVYDAEGVDGEITVKIEMIDGSDVWHELYVGTLDLLTKEDIDLVDDATAPTPYTSNFLYSEINLKPQNLASLLFSRNDIPLSMRCTKNIDGGDLGDYGQFNDFQLSLHSKVIILESSVELPSAETLVDYENHYPFDQNKKFYFNYFNRVINELGIAQNDVKEELDNQTTHTNLEPAFVFEEAITCNIFIDIEGVITQSNFVAFESTEYSLYLNLVSESGSIQEHNIISALFGSPTDDSTNVNVDVSFLDIDFSKGEKVWVFWELVHGTYYDGVGQVSNDVQDIQSPRFDFNFTRSKISFKENSVKPDSEGKAWLVYECLAKSLEIMTGQFDVLKSSFYGRLNSVPSAYPSDGDGSLLALTNGHQIRGNQNGKPLTFKFNELLNSLDTIDCIGMGIEKHLGVEKVVIENRKYFYQDEVLKRYNNVPKIKIKRAKNLYYNQVIIGFSKWENESFNSLDEFNTKVIRNTNFKAVQNKYQRLSKFLGSGYALEIVRREQFKENPTKGNKYDNSNFFIVIRDVNGEYKAEKDEGFGTIENLISPPSSYNLRISPTRSTIKHSQWFNGSMLKKQLDSFDFAEGFGNYELITNLSVGNSSEQMNRNIHEGADFVANTLKAPIFTPDYASFSVPFELDFWLELLQGANRYKQIEFSDRASNHYSGWIQHVKFDVSKMLLNYKILLKPESFPLVPVVDIPPVPPTEEVILPPFTNLCASVDYDASERTDVLFDMSSFSGFGGIYVTYEILSGSIDFETYAMINSVWTLVDTETGLTGNGTFVAPYHGENDFKIEMTKHNAPAGTLTICVVIS